MQDSNPPIADPFALMMNPEAVFRALAQSDRLSRLKSRVCRPLDKPLIPKVGSEQDEFDRAVDAAAPVQDESAV